MSDIMDPGFIEFVSFKNNAIASENQKKAGVSSNRVIELKLGIKNERVNVYLAPPDKGPYDSSHKIVAIETAIPANGTGGTFKKVEPPIDAEIHFGLSSSKRNSMGDNIRHPETLHKIKIVVEKELENDRQKKALEQFKKEKDQPLDRKGPLPSDAQFQKIFAPENHR